jgi:hypothetical protein
LATAGKLVNDDNLISYILIGLNFKYNSVVTMLITKENHTLGDVYS